MISVEKPGSPLEILEHHGVKGQKWGVRKAATKSGGFRGKQSKGPSKTKRAFRALGRGADNTIFELSKDTDQVQNEITSKATDRLIKSLPGIKAKHGEYGKMRNRMKRPFSPEARAYRADVKKSYLKHLEKSANEITNVRGTRQYTIKENGKPGTSQYFWKVSTQSVKHADDGTFTVHPVYDDEGWIIDIELVEDDMAQTMERGSVFLEHVGVKGMKWGVRNQRGPTQSSRKFGAKFPTGKSRAREITRARNAQVLRAAKFHASPKGSPQREAARKAFLKHPDRATSLRLTRGEKAVFAIIGVGTAPTGFGVGVGIGTAARVATRRNIEKKQASKAYG